MDVPVYKITIKEDDINSGVDYVALVDSPAILRNFLAFSKHEKFVASDEQRVVSGPLMIPDIPIYRRDDMGEFYVVFERPTIYSIAKKFMRELRNDKVNQMHNPAAKVEGVYMFESFIIDSTRGINTPKGFEHLPDGTWFGSYKIDNDEVWANVKNGTFNGFSVEGFFDLNMERVSDDALLKKVIEVIKEGKCNKPQKQSLRDMNAKDTLKQIEKLLFGEKEKFMDAVLKGADGNEINAVVDGELVPGTSIKVDGAPVIDGDYEINGNMVSCQGGVIVTVTPIEAEMTDEQKVAAEIPAAVATMKAQITELETKLSAVKTFDATELTAQIETLTTQNKTLTDSLKQLFSVVEKLAAEPAAKATEKKKDAFQIQKEKENADLTILANTLSKLSKK